MVKGVFEGVAFAKATMKRGDASVEQVFELVVSRLRVLGSMFH
jgi:hypothetical protein